ncbi:MAG: hypothetical protein R3213_10415, partial [Flavobacteriaceae bacterium]|nr:hypothetical protein [Flavobacteriaceae bacterium]
MLKLDKLKKDDVVCILTYAQVKNILPETNSHPSRINLVNLDNGQELRAEGNGLIETFYSDSFYDKEEQLPKTKLAEAFVTKTKNLPFTVVFEKKDGSERTLRGKMVSSEGWLGYSTVFDFDKSGVRQV